MGHIRWITCWMFFAAALPSAAEQPLLEGQVRLRSGEPVANALVALFDVADQRPGVVSYATTDATGYFVLSARPQAFALGQNYPNPFNPSTVIPYHVASAAHVQEVFNLLGQRLATLVDGVQSAGSHTARWDAMDAAGRSVGAGVYIYRLSSAGQVQSRRMVLVDGQAGVASVGAMPERQLSADADETPVYGLAVAGAGLVAYVDAEFRVETGVGPVEIVVKAAERAPRGKVTAEEILGDVNNDGRVDLADVLLVMMYSLDASINIPNISLGDMNNDGRVELIDAYLMVNHILGQSDSSLLNPSAPINLTNHFRDDESPAWSPDGRRLAFVSDRDGNDEIYVMDANGDNLTRLTNNDSPDWRPVWSPYGRLAFSSDRDGNDEIYVMDANGDNLTRLTNNDSTDWRPVWSPDGRRLAFTSWRDGDNEIYVIDADGDNLTRLTFQGDDESPAWSPDGRRLAFHSWRGWLMGGYWRIYVMDADGGNIARLSGGGVFPVWSPDGRRLAFDSARDGDNEIYVIDTDGDNLTRLTDNDSDDWSPVWSPDGLRLAFVSERDGNDEIYVIGVDGDNLTRLTFHDARDWSPVWSPDGLRLAFVSLRDGNREIYVIDVD